MPSRGSTNQDEVHKDFSLLPFLKSFTCEGMSQKRLAIVLSGGGARGAYEAGVIHYIRTMLPAHVRERHFDIQCGSSIGAINSCFMTAMAHDPEAQGKEIRHLWERVREEDVYRRDPQALLGFLSKTGRGVVTNLFMGARRSNHFHGFLDTSPLLPFLERIIPWQMISKNIANGLVKALSIVATNVFTGKMELFIEKQPQIEYTGEYLTHMTQVTALHVMASCAIPVVFPSVLVDCVAYIDGGLRLNTPMSPAIQLGADSILIIGLHHKLARGEHLPEHGEKGVQPPLGQIVGRVMNSIFLDRTQYDIEQLERINRIVDWSIKLYGDRYLEDLNHMLQRENIRGDIADRGLKRITALRMLPSEDIAELFNRYYQMRRRTRLTTFERVMMRILDIDPAGSTDFLSYISFRPDYLKALLDLGFEDARTHHDKLVSFLEQ